MIGLKPPSECNPEADDNSDNEYHQSYSINIEEAKTGTSIGFSSCLISSSLSLSLSPLFLLPILFLSLATAYKAAISSPVILFVIIGAVCIAMFSCSCCQVRYDYNVKVMVC